MTLRAALREPLPPRLTMDEYCEWVMDTVCRMSPAHIARQKAIEKRIAVPFCFPEDGLTPHHPRPCSRHRATRHAHVRPERLAHVRGRDQLE